LRVIFPVLMLAGLAVAGCGESGDAGAAADPYAGMDKEILAWRSDIEANHVACKTKVEGKGCESFQVTCKVAGEITPQEQAKGVKAQVVAAMNFNGRNPDGSTGKPGSAFAEFTRTGSAWSRAETEPVNLTTCAPF
jgi:hypothetical protein